MHIDLLYHMHIDLLYNMHIDLLYNMHIDLLYNMHIDLLYNMHIDLLYNMHFYFYFQSGWSISVDLVIGPKVAISYLTEKASTVSKEKELYFFYVSFIHHAVFELYLP